MKRVLLPFTALFLVIAGMVNAQCPNNVPIPSASFTNASTNTVNVVLSAAPITVTRPLNGVFPRLTYSFRVEYRQFGTNVWHTINTQTYSAGNPPAHPATSWSVPFNGSVMLRNLNANATYQVRVTLDGFCSYLNTARQLSSGASPTTTFTTNPVTPTCDFPAGTTADDRLKIGAVTAQTAEFHLLRPSNRSQFTHYAYELNWRIVGNKTWHSFTTPRMAWAAIDSTWVISDLRPNTNYEARVRVMCFGPNGSNLSPFTPLADPNIRFNTQPVEECDTVSRHRVISTTTTSATIIWRPVMELHNNNGTFVELERDVISYSLRYRPSNTFAPWEMVTIDANDANFRRLVNLECGESCPNSTNCPGGVWDANFPARYNVNTNRNNNSPNTNLRTRFYQVTLPNLVSGTTYEYQFWVQCREENIADNRESGWNKATYYFTLPTQGCLVPPRLRHERYTTSTCISNPATGICGTLYPTSFLTPVTTYVLRWNGVGSATNYTVQYREVTTPQGPFLNLQNVAGTNLQFKFPRPTLVNPSGNAALEPVVGFPDIPLMNNFDINGNPLCTTTDVGTVPVARRGNAGNECFAASLQNGRVYQFRVRANCTVGSGSFQSAWSPVLSFKAEQLTNIGVICRTEGGGLAAENFTVYPNPSNGTFNIDMFAVANGVANIDVLDIAGRTVYSQTVPVEEGTNTHSVNLNGAAAGVYVLRLMQGTDVKTARIVVR